GRRTIDGAELARVAQDRAEAWAAPGTGGHGHAQSQSQSQSRGQGTGHGHSAVSARNSFRGLVTAIRSDAVMSQVEIQCGPYRVVSRISTEAVRALGLEPGALATARVKATDVVLEGAQPRAARRPRDEPSGAASRWSSPWVSRRSRDALPAAGRRASS